MTLRSEGQKQEGSQGIQAEVGIWDQDTKAAFVFFVYHCGSLS